MNLFAHMRLFTTIAEMGSLQKVARHHNVSSAALSKKIAALEAHLKVQLFERGGRRLRLTPIGERYWRECEAILDRCAQAERVIADARAEPSGVLKIVSGHYFAERFILPNLPAFLARYPEVTVELKVTESLPDLKAGQADIAFGMTLHNAPQDLICRPVATSHYVLCAAPGYLQQYGTPHTPEALKAHRYITSSQRTPDNVLVFGAERIVLPKLLRCDEVASMLSAARYNAGIVNLHHYIVEPYLQSGELVALLPHHVQATKPVYLFYRNSAYVEPSIRVFIDFFLAAGIKAV